VSSKVPGAAVGDGLGAASAVGPSGGETAWRRPPSLRTRVVITAIRATTAAATSQRPEGKRGSRLGPWLISSNRRTCSGQAAASSCNYVPSHPCRRLADHTADLKIPVSVPVTNCETIAALVGRGHAMRVPGTCPIGRTVRVAGGHSRARQGARQAHPPCRWGSRQPGSPCRASRQPGSPCRASSRLRSILTGHRS
jgi:hypothetical protein